MISIIDIGSNSVRLCVFLDGTTFRKKVTSQLGEGLALDGLLKDEPMKRTKNAIIEFIDLSLQMGVKKCDIHPFATAAVRQAKNGQEFMNSVYFERGVKIELISGETEGQIAILGALDGQDGWVLDLGGGSTELVGSVDKKCVYTHSLNLGAVRLYDLFKDDKKGAYKYLIDTVKEYGSVSVSNLVGIGGTISNIGYILSGENVFEMEKNNGQVIEIDKLHKLIDTLYDMTIDERVERFNISERRAKVIACGGLMLYTIMEYLKIDKITVSENDNLVGYYRLITKGF